VCVVGVFHGFGTLGGVGSVVVPLRATCPVWLVHGVQHTVTFGVRSRSRRFGSSVGRIVLSWYY
jgi:hypothetical protein